MSKLILPDTVEKKEEEALPFIMPELEVSEIEKLLKTKPEIARIFVEKAACGDVNWEGLSPAERGLLLHGIVETSFKNPNEVSAIQALWEADWIRRPPTPEEFINDPKYLGEEVSAGIYAPWRKDLIYVLDPKNEIHEWCFTGDTKISLYNEEPISIKQLVKEERTSFNVFSVNKDKKQVIGSGFNARLTRRNAELVEVLFVDGLIVRCTPDHPFLLSNGTYKQAQFLDCYDELMSCSSVNQVFMVTKCDKREDVYDISVEEHENFALENGVIVHNCLTGSIGCGKTNSAVIAQLYKLAVLTCLKNIPTYYGLNPSTLISFGLFTTSLEKAEDSISSVFRKMISDSPYFRNIFPLRRSRTVKKILNSQTSEGQTMSDYEVVLPQNLQVLLGSKVNHALSLAVVSAILDEMNFRTKRTVKLTQDVDAAAKLYDQVRFRITSRFERLGHVPGLLCVISSRRTSADFIEAHIAQVDGGLSQKTGSWTAKNNPHIYISSYSQWDVKPKKFYKEGQPKSSFYVFLGTSEKSSRILSDEEVSYYPKDSPNLIAIPSTLRLQFESDINSALRELAGISSAPASLLFDDPQKINNIWDYTRKNPFIDEELYIGVKTKRSISSYLLRENLFKDVGFTLIPKYHPDMLRFIHIDLSKSGDATGIAMGGISAIKETIGSNLLGEQITASSIPEIFIDFAISLKAPQGDQIDYEKIQQFISYLRLNGFHIHVVSFDTYNSVGPMQMLGKDGFSVLNVSVDRTDTAYVWFRDSVINNNIKCYKHALLEKQLSNLIHDYSTGRAKVDHPSMFPDGTRGDKELGDGIAGVVFNAFTFLTDIKKNPYTSNIGLVGNAFEHIPNSKSSSIHEAFVVSSNEKEMLFNKIEEENPFKLY